MSAFFPKPTGLQLALALTIVRSKPDGCTVREYIVHLRHQISTQWLGPNGECQQRLNAAAFWQEQCTLLQAENQGLRDRTVSLERQSELLATKLKNVETATVETASAQRSLPTSARSGVKRSRAKPTDDNPMRPAKRSKFASSPGLSRDENLQDTIEEDFGALNGGPCGKVVIESIWELQKLYKSASPVPSALAYYVNRASTSITAVLQGVCAQYLTVLDKSISPEARKTRESSRSAALRESMQEENFSAVFRAVASAYSSLLFGVTRFPAVESEKRVLGSMLYSIIHMYDNVLSLISWDPTRICNSSESFSPLDPSDRRSSEAGILTKSRKVSKAIADFLNAAISALDPKSAPHRELLEGFMFVLVDRLGKNLYLFTFGRLRRNTIEEDLSPNEGSTLTDKAKEIARIEAPHLLSILERAICMASQNFADASATINSKSMNSRPSAQFRYVSKEPISTRKHMLSEQAQNRLQQTLVNAVFGPQEEGDENFSECLRLPGQPSTFTQPPTIEERDIPDWYTKELWGLLGWDILASESDW